MLLRSLIVGCVLFAASQVIDAQEVTYLQGDQPAFSVIYPAGWIVRTPRVEGRNVISSYPIDGGLLWQGLWVMRDVSTIEESIERLQSMELGLFEDTELTKEPWVEAVNGVEVHRYSGSGLFKGETPVETLMSFFEVAGEKVGVVGYIGEPKAIETHRADLERMLDSLAVER